jgi:hypothetical protein
MLEKKQERERALAADRRRLLEVTPEKALELLVEHPYPVTLIQSLAEEDFYFLVHGIGVDDALPVLALASNAQWEYMLDMEAWSADKPDNRALTQWLARLLKADADRFTHWIVHDQSDLLTYYLNRNLELIIREYEQDPGDIADDFFTDDDTYYVRPRPSAAGTSPNPAAEAERDTFVRDLLRRLSVYDFMVYQGALLESAGVIPAECEEEMLRLRNVRLAEKGFLPLEEAVGVYQPLTVTELIQRRRPAEARGGRPVQSYPLPVEPRFSARGDTFGRTLAAIQDPGILERLQMEFAGLCNQVAAADQRPVREKKDLSGLVEKVSGYIGLGLEKALAETGTDAPYAAPNLVQTYLLIDLFRVGYGCALALKWEAERWQCRSWAKASGLPLSFWGEAWLGVLGGLLLKKPLFFDNAAAGSLYREFSKLSDIRQSEQVLAQIMAMDDLLSHMALDVVALAGKRTWTYASLLLTWWAGHVLGLADSAAVPTALTLDQFKIFFDRLWERPALSRKISRATREAFLGWLGQRSGLADFDISERLGLSLEALFTLLENELGGVAREDLDPRFIYLFRFRRE